MLLGRAAARGLVESPHGTRAVQRSFNQSFLDNDLGIRFSPK
jgi:hypothetical protein